MGKQTSIAQLVETMKFEALYLSTGGLFACEIRRKLLSKYGREWATLIGAAIAEARSELDLPTKRQMGRY